MQKRGLTPLIKTFVNSYKSDVILKEEKSSPLTSIIMATYHRTDVIGFAIRSVLAQTHKDWELLVIGDACTDDTERAVLSFRDPRIRFFNLRERVGDQSGPTNFGIRQAKGRWLAFLNHDDFWFPDHLDCCIAHLEKTESDLVFALQFDADPDGSIRIPSMHLEGFSPFLSPNISTWVCNAKWAIAQTPMRPFGEVFTYPSIDWLLSGWRKGGRYCPMPKATVFVLTTITREGSYRKKESSEHAMWFTRFNQEPSLREELLTRALLNPNPTHLQGYSCIPLLRGLTLRLAKQALLWLRCNPIAWVIYLRCPKKWGLFPRKGALRKKLYQKRGLNERELCK